MIQVSTLPVRDFFEANTTRLISTAYIDEPALAPLVDDPEELAILETLEGLSSSRRGLPDFIPEDVHPDELVNEHHGYGWTYINAAFCYTRATGNRFNSATRGAWYASWGEAQIETVHAEVTWHLSEELRATGVYENVTSYRELIASFSTPFHDLTKFANDVVFDPDPAVSYKKGQHLATDLRAKGSNGVLFPSIRCPGGLCLVAFRPSIIQNIRQGNAWTFTWWGDRNPQIARRTA